MIDPEDFIIVYCEDCRTRHAPIRGCSEERMNMFHTLEEVKAGLAEGKSYKRVYGWNYSGCEYLRPIGPGRFEHTVSVPGGGGGVAELDISILDGSPPWPTTGYELDD